MILLKKHRHATSRLLDVIEKYSYGNPDLLSHLTREMKLFRKVEDDLEEFLQQDIVMPCFQVYKLQTRISFLIIRF